MTMEKINILIVEDESIVAMDLATALHQDDYEVIGIAKRSEEAMQLFNQHAVDIVLMDIRLAGSKDGIDTAVDLMKIRQTPVIYLTAFTDHETIERVKPTYPSAFLAKPYLMSNVRVAIELALNSFTAEKTRQGQGEAVETLQEQGGGAAFGAPETGETGFSKEPIWQMGDSIFIKYNYRFVKLHLADVLFVQANRNHVSIHTNDKKFVLRLSLGQLFDRLVFDRLVRIHRSYAVNIDRIQSFTEQAVVTDKGEFPIGRSYKEDFLQRFDLR